MEWDELYGSMMRAAGKAARKLNDTADQASLKMKLSAAQTKLDEAYSLLGRISYLHFTGEEDLASKVALAIENVEHAKEEIRTIKRQIVAAKKKAEEARALYEATDAVELEEASSKKKLKSAEG